MPNELLFLLQTLVSLAAVLAACRMGYGYVVGLIGALVILMNLFVLKQMDLFGFSVTGGNVLYASIFLATDIISEHYGRRKAHQAVWLGFGVSIFFVAMTRFILYYQPNAYDTIQRPMEQLFGLVPRVVSASMLAYLISQHLDVRLFESLGKWTGGRWLWLRNNCSTGVSQMVDTLVFTLVAFWGVLPDLLAMILFTYLIKVIVAALDTPFIYLSTHPWFRPRDSQGRSWRPSSGSTEDNSLAERTL